MGIDMAGGKTLLEIHEETAKHSHGDMKNRCRRQLSRRDSDEQVGRALKEHFGNFSEYEVDIRNVDGNTLRQTIRDGKSDAKSSKKKLRSSFWKSLKMKFAAVDDPCRRLHVDNPEPRGSACIGGCVEVQQQQQHDDPEQAALA